MGVVSFAYTQEGAMAGLKTRLVLVVGVPAALAMVGGAIAFAANPGGSSAEAPTAMREHHSQRSANHQARFQHAPSGDAQASQDGEDCPNKNKGTTEDATAGDQT